MGAAEATKLDEQYNEMERVCLVTSIHLSIFCTFHILSHNDINGYYFNEKITFLILTFCRHHY